MIVTLLPVRREQLRTLWTMQVEAFSALLEKYQDHETNPAAERFDRIVQKYEQPWTRYYFIVAGDQTVGAIRIIDKKDGSRKRISPVWIMPAYRNRGYARQAIREAERLYGADHWCLDTILQEQGILHLYETLGYHRTGRIETINERMDIVFLEKDQESAAPEPVTGTDAPGKPAESSHIFSACGNDCACCPRFTAHPYEKSDEALRHTAELWHSIGYTDRVFSVEEISCMGCRPENRCRYRIVQCCRDRGVRTCANCPAYACELLQECFRVTNSFRSRCREACTDEEYEQVHRAFFKKEENLKRLRAERKP